MICQCGMRECWDDDSYFYDGLSGKVSKNFQIDVLAVSFAPSESVIMICRAATRTNITLNRVEGAEQADKLIIQECW